MNLKNTQLQDIHDRLLLKLKLQEKSNQDRGIAIKIENLLRYLKTPNFSQKQGLIESELQAQADTIIQDAFNLLNATRKGRGIGSFQSLNSLFHHSHGFTKEGKRVSGTLAGISGADDIFEAELAAVIASIESRATGKNITISDKLAGQNQLNIAYNEMTAEIMKEYPKFIEKKLKSKITKTKDYNITITKSGKTDVYGTSLEIEGQLNPEWQELFELFRGRTFSLKNYSSMTKQTQISLGATDYYKSIMGSLYSLGYDRKTASAIFYRGIHSHRSEVPKHFYHLQVGYELMGLGLGQIVENEFQEAKAVDFFIYNDPSSNNVFVRSTAEILLDYLKDDMNTNKFRSQIKISKSKFH